MVYFWGKFKEFSEHLVINNCCSNVEKVVRQSQMQSQYICDGKKPSTSGVKMVNKDTEWDLVMDGRKQCHEFIMPETEHTIDSISKKNFTPKSKTKILWAVNMYGEGRKNRLSSGLYAPEIINAKLDCVGMFAKSDLCYSLSCFICGVKKLDGSDYPPNSLRDIVLMIQMYLHENSLLWKLLDQEEFITLQNVLDNTVKERHSQGLCICRLSDMM